MIILRKSFSDDEENTHTGRNLALAGVGTALAFAGAKKGLLGSGLQKNTNALWAKTGKLIGSNSMINSGAKGVGVAMAKQKGADLSTMAGKRLAVNKANQFKSILAK